MRWLLVFLLAFLLFSGLKAWLARIGLGRLPGDFSFRLGGREWYVPLASSLLLSLLAMVIGALCMHECTLRPQLSCGSSTHGAVAAAHPACSSQPRRPGPAEPGIGAAGRAVGLVGHGLGMHQQVQVAAQRPQAHADADQDRDDVDDLVDPAAVLGRCFEGSNHADQADEGQRHVRMAAHQFTLVPLAKAVLADACGELHRLSSAAPRPWLPKDADTKASPSPERPVLPP